MKFENDSVHFKKNSQSFLAVEFSSKGMKRKEIWIQVNDEELYFPAFLPFIIQFIESIAYVCGM